MSDERLRFLTAAGLVIGALLGMAGTFAPSAQIRGPAWGADGMALVMASALLAVHHLRNGREQLAAGFLVFLAGETLIVLGSAMDARGERALVRCGCRLVGGSPRPHQRGCGLRARLTALSAPLPFGAYPFLAITVLGWAWAHLRTRPTRNAAP
jgi:hypothetical protein